MDTELLSGMVKELILDNDSVSLPGLGMFVAAQVPAAFSDRGYTINPPYRKLSFVKGESTDELLVNLYASSNGIEKIASKKILTHYLGELRKEVISKKTVILPGLGRLRATKDNLIFFVADEDLDIYPEGFALKPVSLKTHPLSTLPEVGPELQAMAQQPQPKPEAQPKPQPQPQTGSRVWIVAALGVIGAAAVLLAAFIALAHFAPEFTDSLLYTEEELRIINYQCWN